MRLIIYFIAAFLITGCSYSSQYTRNLDEAERLLSQNPQKAFERLSIIDISEFNDSSTMARWALLYSEAMVARNLYAPSDSIINIAIDYYSTHNLAQNLRRAQNAKLVLADTTSSKANSLISALYIQKEKELQLYKERIRHNRDLYCGLLLMLLAAGVIIWQRLRLKTEAAQTEALMAEASALKRDAATNRHDLSMLEAKLHRLIDSRFFLINSLCETYYETQSTNAERKAIVEKVKAEISAIKNNPAIITDMERIVNDCRGNLLKHLAIEYHDIKPQDYRLALYMACGFSNRTISLLLGESIDVVYKRKSRLKSRIANRPMPHRDDFMSIF